MKYLLGWPQLVEYHGILVAAEGTCELRNLGVTLQLQRFGTRSNESSATVYAFIPLSPSPNMEAPFSSATTGFPTTGPVPAIPVSIPGVGNMLADFGTRQLNPDEWEDDDFELDYLFTISTPFDMVTNLPKISMSDYLQEDFEELEVYNLKNKEEDGAIAVFHLGEWLTFVPTKLRRPIFWS